MLDMLEKGSPTQRYAAESLRRDNTEELRRNNTEENPDGWYFISAETPKPRNSDSPKANWKEFYGLVKYVETENPELGRTLRKVYNLYLNNRGIDYRSHNEPENRTSSLRSVIQKYSKERHGPVIDVLIEEIIEKGTLPQRNSLWDDTFSSFVKHNMYGHEDRVKKNNGCKDFLKFFGVNLH